MWSPLLLVALAALLLGPLLARAVHRDSRAVQLMDGFVLTTIGGLVLLEVVPGAAARGDIAALLVLAAGAVLPSWAERRFRRGARVVHTLLVGLAVLGVALHSALDGAVLAAAAQRPGSLLGLGVVLHQIPVGLTVWWVLRDRPTALPWLMLAAMGAATVGGFTAAERLLTLIPEAGAARWQALIAGTLLHVVAHPLHEAESHEPATPWLAGVGSLTGLALLGVLLLGGRFAEAGVQLEATGTVLVDMALDSAPAVLLAYLAVGVLRVLLPEASLGWLGRGSPLVQAGKGVVVGLPVPICSCGVVPMYEGLVRAGVPSTAAVAFLIAAPELGLDALLLTLPLLGVEFAALRVAAAAGVAVAVSLIVGRLIVRSPVRRTLPISAGATPRSGGWRTMLWQGTQGSVDTTGPWIIAGLLVAALLAPSLDAARFADIPAWIQLPAFALLGVPMYVCASAATPFAAVLIAAGVSPGAALAFLLTGPATNVTTVGMLSRLHSTRVAVAFITAMLTVSVLAGAAANVAAPTLTAPTGSGATVGELPLLLRGVALVLVLLLLGESLLRRGPRAFLGELRLTKTTHEGHRRHQPTAPVAPGGAAASPAPLLR